MHRTRRRVIAATVLAASALGLVPAPAGAGRQLTAR